MVIIAIAGGMYNVKHLYIIGSINIESAEEMIFKDSFIDEIIFEDVFAQLDIGFLLGARVNSVIIRNSNLHFKSQSETYESSNYTEKDGLLLITNTSLNVLIPLSFADFYSTSVVQCEIGQIQNSDSLTSIGALRLNLEHTLIGSIEPYALSHINIHNLSMHHCLVPRIKKAVFSGSEINYIVIADSQLKIVSELAFADSTIDNMQFKRSHVERFMTNAFERARINELEISNTQIDHIASNLFDFSIIKKLRIETTYIKNMHPKPFKGSQIDNLNITQCDFAGAFGRDFFEGLAPARFSFTNSTLNCDPDDCELNSLLLKPPSHDLSWNFAGNTCRLLRGSNVCSRPSIAVHSGLTCRFSWLLAECICTSSRPKFLSPNVSIVIIGDCDELKIEQRHSSITALYLFRIGKCEIHKMPRNVKTVKIYNSNVVLRGTAFDNGRITDFSLHDSKLHVHDNSFNGVSIDKMTIHDSQIGYFVSTTLMNTDIKRLYINRSSLKTGALFGAASQLSMENSVVIAAKGLSTISTAHLKNNTVLCCCENNECRKDDVMKRLCIQYFSDIKCKHKSSSTVVQIFAISMIFVIIDMCY